MSSHQSFLKHCLSHCLFPLEYCCSPPQCLLLLDLIPSVEELLPQPTKAADTTAQAANTKNTFFITFLPLYYDTSQHITYRGKRYQFVLYFHTLYLVLIPWPSRSKRFCWNNRISNKVSYAVNSLAYHNGARQSSACADSKLPEYCREPSPHPLE